MPDDDARQFYALYLARFATGFGLVSLLTLLPTYITLFEPSGFVIGLFTTAFTVAQTVAVVPLAWAGDRYDKRTVLLVSLLVGVVAYAGFGAIALFEGTSLSFIAARAVQGIAVTGSGLMTLSLVGERSAYDERASRIGTANAARFAASIVGGLSAGVVYDAFGFTPIYTTIVVMLAAVSLWLWLELAPDDTRIEGFPFSDLAFNERILTLSSFRSQYAFAVTLVRTWVPIYAGVSVAQGGLGYVGSAFAVSIVLTSEKTTNMLLQPYTGRLSDRFNRSFFVFLGGTMYAAVAVLVPFSPFIGDWLGLPASYPVVGALSAAFPVVVGMNMLLGVADSFREPASMALFADEGSDGNGVASSFGVRELIWRPGSVLAPMLGGFLMTGPGMHWVFFSGGAFAFSGALAFLGATWYTEGRGALTRW
ncbi:MFS transporter [Haloarchaeobius iranensis]|uniref:Predicted arabinose efflux permease, MFS family n=1 Tax=Haloarchaeobius iranensis TaxID=996166 RepID=A0A1H0AJA9_9EURY|nr:MFS transporter [Haloarchaeobius iranensis]SDN33404.1 Predicted arabinose efflux permease, MFS family [Haloarchaeobius iranensis]